MATGKRTQFVAMCLPWKTLLPGKGGAVPKAKSRDLSDTKIRSLKPMSKPYDYMEGRGFGLRVMGSPESPVRTFILIARYPGSKHPTRRAIGNYPHMSLADAHRVAEDWRGLIKKKIDPKTIIAEQAVREETLAKTEAAKTKTTFESVAQQFIARHVSQTRKAEIVAREIRREFIARWGLKQISEITRHDVVAVLDAAVDRGAPYQAHKHPFAERTACKRHSV
jgi:Arm DNA-binding domain